MRPPARWEDARVTIFLVTWGIIQKRKNNSCQFYRWTVLSWYFNSIFLIKNDVEYQKVEFFFHFYSLLIECRAKFSPCGNSIFLSIHKSLLWIDSELLPFILQVLFPILSLPYKDVFSVWLWVLTYRKKFYTLARSVDFSQKQFNTSESNIKNRIMVAEDLKKIFPPHPLPQHPISE